MDVLVKSIYYTDWNDMIVRTNRDIEFLEAFGIEYTYFIKVNKGWLEVEFICKNQ